MTFGCRARSRASRRRCAGRTPRDHVVGDLHHDRHVVLDEQIEVACSSRIALSRALSGRGLLRMDRPPARRGKQHRLGAHGARDFQPALSIGKRTGGVVGAPRQCGRASRWRAQHISWQSPSSDQPEACIRRSCCATMRFSRTVMPGNRRMFWNVPATRPCARSRSPACAQAETGHRRIRAPRNTGSAAPKQ